MGLSELEHQAGAAEDTMTPGVRGLLGVVRALGFVLRASLLFTLPLCVVLGAAWGAQLGTLTLFLGLGLGVLAGLVPELLRRPLLTVAYRSVLERAQQQGLQAVGGATSAAMPSLGPPKMSWTPPPPPTWVEPVRPPPRVGDPDAEDFDD